MILECLSRLSGLVYGEKRIIRSMTYLVFFFVDKIKKYNQILRRNIVLLHETFLNTSNFRLREFSSSTEKWHTPSKLKDIVAMIGCVDIISLLEIKVLLTSVYYAVHNVKK